MERNRHGETCRRTTKDQGKATSRAARSDKREGKRQAIAEYAGRCYHKEMELSAFHFFACRGRFFSSGDVCECTLDTRDNAPTSIADLRLPFAAPSCLEMSLTSARRLPCGLGGGGEVLLPKSQVARYAPSFHSAGHDHGYLSPFDAENLHPYVFHVQMECHCQLGRPLGRHHRASYR